MDKKYRIRKAPGISYDDRISVKVIDAGKVAGLDISVMRFRSTDDAVGRILGYLKELVTKGDRYFNKKDYDGAR